jgi:hypothetical protein
MIKFEDKFTYTFYNHFHPYVGELIEKLNRKSIDGLLNPIFHESPALNQHFFDTLYDPNNADKKKIEVKFSPKKIDVSEHGAYAIYNWELLFHVPLTIAVHLSNNQRFAEAQRWFHYIFDPTSNDGQFWRFIDFRKEKDNKQIDELLYLLSKPADECTETELDEKKVILSGYKQLRNNPFQPHVVARTRPLAYQYNVVMKYLDNLIAWGDNLFRQDTIETLNEATQVYVLAANLLGKKPEQIPQPGNIKPKTFAQLRVNNLDKVGNALVELEGQFPFSLYSPSTKGIKTDQTNTLFGIGRTLYFCIPRNDKLLGYWDTVADRLFKIRHCMNIEGLVRQLPLFQPPIDPGMLVKAAAAGIDVSSMVSGLNQPLSPVRSILLIQKANEICGEVRGLGGALLSALEKKDVETLGLLRQKHEINIQQLAQDVRFLQWKEAEAATKSLLKGRESAVERYKFYQRLLGVKEEDLSAVTELAVEPLPSELTEENFDEVYGTLVESYAQDVATHELTSLNVIDEGKLYLNRNEDEELNNQMPLARDYMLASSITDGATSLLALLPDFDVQGAYWGIGPKVGVSGGEKLAAAGRAATSGIRARADYANAESAAASKTSGYERRADEWKLQSNSAARELMQIGTQIISSLIREQITQREYDNLKTQIEQTQEIDRFLHDKFTNEALYGWMQGELSKLYYEYYKFAFDIARRAEQTMKHELMRPELDDINFIKFNYWDGGRKGLLSGEALQLDLKRMEMAYHDHNKREYELTKNISLRQLNPMALLSLKATGSCEVTIPEWLYDMDKVAYMRRMKNVSLSIPAVTGPYTSINCTLSLLKSSLRRSSEITGDKYARAVEEEDTRFVDYYGTIQSIVTSNAQNDSGLFETNLRDERVLPFEGYGAISTWKLELPADFRQFDYDTISDIIMHIRYTAREGGGVLTKEATDQLKNMVKKATTSEMALLLNLKHDLPTEWNHFLNGNDSFSANINRNYFPYITQGKDISISEISLHGITGDREDSIIPDGIDFESLSNNLNGTKKEFNLILSDSNLLKRDSETNVFVILKYALEI